MNPLASELRNEIRRVAQEHPDLGLKGFQVGGVSDDAQNDFLRPSADTVNQVLLALEWLAGFAKTVRFNRRASTFGWIYLAERWHDDSGDGGNHYIANGAFIVAALICGFKITRCKSDEPKVYINIGKAVPRPSNAAHPMPPTCSPIRHLPTDSSIRRLPTLAVGR